MSPEIQSVIDQWTTGPVAKRERLLESLAGANHRLLYYFAGGCVRSPNLKIDRGRRGRAVELIEDVADGRIEIGAAWASFAPHSAPWPDLLRCFQYAKRVHPGIEATAYAAAELCADPGAEVVRQGKLLAGIAGPGWWGTFGVPHRTGPAVSLARAMYEAREFSAMPILADALEDAGYDGADWLALLRDTSWPWCRGCRAIDDILDLRDAWAIEFLDDGAAG